MVEQYVREISLWNMQVVFRLWRKDYSQVLALNGHAYVLARYTVSVALVQPICQKLLAIPNGLNYHPLDASEELPDRCIQGASLPSLL